MIADTDIQCIPGAVDGDPFSLLGLHSDADGRHWLRAFLTGLLQVEAVDPGGTRVLCQLECRHADGFFEGKLPSAAADYRLRTRWADGSRSVVDDPYRFGSVLGEMDVGLMGEGKHLRPCQVLGAVLREMQGVAGTSFAVWALNASLEISSREGRLLPQKADPYALQCELRPATASVVAQMPLRVAASDERRRANALDVPMSIYEGHLGSWRRKDGKRWLDWDELAAELVPCTRELGFTHLELMPITEHPFDGSWGDQPIGIYAPTSRFGDPAGFRRFVEACHGAGIGWILDWVPAHFPSDAHGQANFDGSHLYEYADPGEGFHQDWNTLVYNLGRTEVANFLVGNALAWLERLGHGRPARGRRGVDALPRPQPPGRRVEPRAKPRLAPTRHPSPCRRAAADQRPERAVPGHPGAVPA